MTYSYKKWNDDGGGDGGGVGDGDGGGDSGIGTQTLRSTHWFFLNVYFLPFAVSVQSL